jgi:hypothetical protein
VLELAVTVDDFCLRRDPLLGPEAKDEAILRALARRKVQAALFVTGQHLRAPAAAKRLAEWDRAGHLIGNHTFAHSDYHETGFADFIEDVRAGDRVVRPLKSFARLFRFPYLNAGDTPEKRDQIQAYLAALGYRNGHVTVHTLDWYYSERLVEALGQHSKPDLAACRDAYLGHVWERCRFFAELAIKTVGRPIKHTIELHHNLLNALFLDELLDFLVAEGVTLIDAADAFADPIFYCQPDVHPASGSLIWLLARAAASERLPVDCPGHGIRTEKPTVDAALASRERSVNKARRKAAVLFVRAIVCRLGKIRVPFGLLFQAYYTGAQRLVGAVFKPLRVVLACFVTGSIGRGSFDFGFSDVDLTFVLSPMEAPQLATCHRRMMARYRALRFLLPILDSSPTIYTEDVFHTLGPLLASTYDTTSVARRLFDKGIRSLPQSGSRSHDRLTVLSRLWSRGLVSLESKRGSYRRHLLRTCLTAEDLTIDAHCLDDLVAGVVMNADRVALPPETGVELTLPSGRPQELPVELERRLHDDWGQRHVAEICFAANLDFLEDTPLEASLGWKQSLILTLTTAGRKAIEDTLQTLVNLPWPESAVPFVRFDDVCLPLRRYPFVRLKTRRANPLFFGLMEAKPGPRRITIAGPAFVAMVAINAQFLRRFVAGKHVFQMPPQVLATAMTKLRMVKTAVARSDDGVVDLCPCEAATAPSPAGEVEDRFRYQAELEGSAPRYHERVSLIIVTRNNARLLRSTLASLRRLTVKPDELILADNASTDDTASVCRAYRDDFPVKYVYEPKIGIPYARNAGVAHAAHEIVVFNDDDCEVSATWLEELLLPFRYDPTVGCVGGKVEYSPAGSRLNRFYHEINSAVEDEWRDHT